MSLDPIRLAIAAYTIPSTGAGLGHFLLKAVRELAVANPSWQLEIIGGSSFTELRDLELPNARVIFWDQRPEIRFLTRILKKFLTPSQLQKVPLSLVFRTERFGLSWSPYFNQLWRSLKIDAIWAPNFYLGIQGLSLYTNLMDIKTPILFTIHDIHPAIYPQDWSAEALACFWKELVPFARRCQKVITLTRFQQKSIIQHLKLEPEKVAYKRTPNLMDPQILLHPFQELQIAATLARYHIQKPYFLYPGTATSVHKNHIRLLIAWSELKKRMGASCPFLVCTAKGVRWTELCALINAFELQDRVVFTDTVDTTTLALLIQNSACVVVPSLYEGSGAGPVMDAWMAGKPLICSNIEPILEQMQYYGIQHSDLFDPESVLAITEAAQSALNRLPELQSKACKNQSLVLDRLSNLWKDWTDFYSQSIIRMVKEKSTQAESCSPKEIL